MFPAIESHRPTRRSFLAFTGSLAAAAVWSSRAAGAVVQNPKFADNPFKLGVASGDPWPTGVVIWTRLAPQPLDGGGFGGGQVGSVGHSCIAYCVLRIEDGIRNTEYVRR